MCLLALRGGEEKVLRIDRPRGHSVARVQKVQRERFLRWMGPWGPRVLKFDGAFGPEGCGLPLCGNAYKVSVTGFTFSVI